MAYQFPDVAQTTPASVIFFAAAVMNDLPPSLFDAQKDRCASLLRERCINGLLKFIEQCQRFPVGEGQELHQDDPGNAASGINPEVGITETRPSEATGAPSS